MDSNRENPRLEEPAQAKQDQSIKIKTFYKPPFVLTIVVHSTKRSERIESTNIPLKGPASIDDGVDMGWR